MKVRIVCYEDVNQWILGKFALKMSECLINIGINSDIAKQPDPTADINHFIASHCYGGKKISTDTLMITHVDNIDKLNQLNKQLDNAALGICMSRETMDNLVKLGVSRKKLAYVNPAHDGVIVPRPKVIGITCRVQEDGRKREHFLSKLSEDIDHRFFCFKIMGDGWNDQVARLRKNGFKVEYISDFNYNKYVEFIPSLDYYLYFGQDEGQMGFVDALAAGVETIVTPQGYHLDAKEGISYSFNTYNELLEIFKVLSEKRVRLINSVSSWRWENYTQKHVELWEYLLRPQKDVFDMPNFGYFNGIYSLEKYDKIYLIKSRKIRLLRLKLFYNKYKQCYCIRKRIITKNLKEKVYRLLHISS